MKKLISNKVWHNADEEPQENAKIIWYATGDCIKMCTHTKDMVHGGMTKWAYADELLNLKTQEPVEVLPKIKGWIARDLCGTVNLHSKKPVWKEDFQMWECGEDFYPIEDCLEGNTMFPELNYYDNPIEVEITIKRC